MEVESRKIMMEMSMKGDIGDFKEETSNFKQLSMKVKSQNDDDDDGGND